MAAVKSQKSSALLFFVISRVQPFAVADSGALNPHNRPRCFWCLTAVTGEAEQGLRGARRLQV